MFLMTDNKWVRMLAYPGGGSIESCAEEIRNTRMYLDALNVTHVDDILTVAIVDQVSALILESDSFA